MKKSVTSSLQGHMCMHALCTRVDTHAKKEVKKGGKGKGKRGSRQQSRGRCCSLGAEAQPSCHLCNQTPEPVGAMPGTQCANRAALFGCGPLFQLQPFPPVETQNWSGQGVADVCERDVCLGRSELADNGPASVGILSSRQNAA